MRKSLLYISTTLTLFNSVASYSAGGPNNPPPPAPLGPPLPGVPIDNNLVILFIVAIIIGYFYNTKILKSKTPN